MTPTRYSSQYSITPFLSCNHAQYGSKNKIMLYVIDVHYFTIILFVTLFFPKTSTLGKAY